MTPRAHMTGCHFLLPHLKFPPKINMETTMVLFFPTLYMGDTIFLSSNHVFPVVMVSRGVNLFRDAAFSSDIEPRRVYNNEIYIKMNPMPRVVTMQ